MALKIEYELLKSLVPYARNTRTHPRSQVQKLKASLSQFGWTRPMAIAADKVKGKIVRTMVFGHGILLAALEMADEGIPIPGNDDPLKGPCVDLSHLSPGDRRAYVIADNRLALDSGWDDDMLRIELGELQADGFDLSFTGFELPELTSLLAGGSADGGTPDDAGDPDPAPAGEGNYKEQYGVIVICTGEEHQKLVFEKLKGMGMDARVVAT